jgi:ATP-dependent DNA helicase RecG
MGILAALTEVPKFIRRNTRMARKFDNGMRRQDIPEYPDKALREALTNALVHEIMKFRVAEFS